MTGQIIGQNFGKHVFGGVFFFFFLLWSNPRCQLDLVAVMFAWRFGDIFNNKNTLKEHNHLTYLIGSTAHVFKLSAVLLKARCDSFPH